MWRQIIGQAVYQLIVMLTLMYFGNMMFFDEAWNLVDEPPLSQNRLTLNTIMFQTFILMNLFNQFNCRIVDTDTSIENKENIHPFNIQLLHSPYFWMVTIFEFGVTYLMVDAGGSELGSALIGTYSLTTNQTIVCWVLGLLTFAVNAALKYVPMNFFEWLYFKIDLEDDDNEFNQSFRNKFDNVHEAYKRRYSSIIEGPDNYTESEMVEINDAEKLDNE